MKLVFLHQEATKVTLPIFCKWKWSDVFKVIQNKMSDFLHIGMLQQKEAITAGISKILARY